MRPMAHAPAGGLVPVVARRTLVAALAVTAASFSTEARAVPDEAVFHVAIFRFTKEHLEEAIAAFSAMAAATREEEGNLAYDIFRGIEDDQEFYIVEHWASSEALAAHERSEAFLRYGQGVLTKYATLHDTVTGRPFV